MLLVQQMPLAQRIYIAGPSQHSPAAQPTHKLSHDVLLWQNKCWKLNWINPFATKCPGVHQLLPNQPDCLPASTGSRAANQTARQPSHKQLLHNQLSIS
jgi:hypothetical protein